MENEVKDFDLNSLGYQKTTALFEELIKKDDEFCCERLEETGGVFDLFGVIIKRDCEPRVQDFYNAGIKDTKVIAYYFARLTHLKGYKVFSKILGENVKPLENYSKEEDEKFAKMQKLYYRGAYREMFQRKEIAKQHYNKEKGL